MKVRSGLTRSVEGAVSLTVLLLIFRNAAQKWAAFFCKFMYIFFCSEYSSESETIKLY